MTVAAEQRHTRAHRCPVCDGADGDPRGQGKRCSGYTSADGKWAWCSQIESDHQTDGGLWRHLLRDEPLPREGTFTTHANGKSNALGKRIATYQYRDEHGAHLFDVLRFEPKTFRQRAADGAWSVADVRKVLYRMPELLASDGTVFVCEGEKDADAVAALGLVATCNPMGAGKWSVVADLARTVLADRDVIVIADRDEAGRKHAADVREALADVAHSVIVSEVAKGKDAADWIAAGAVAGDFMRLEPVAIVTDSPFITIGPPEIFAPLPPVPYLIEAMGLTPGAPTLWCGYGFSMKTLSAQACGLAVAIGRPVFGVYHPKRMPVLHLDYEQGERLTRERYIRLARGLGIDPRELEPNWLRLCALPSFYLDNASAADALARAMDGCGLVIVDSLRASAPMLEENSSAFRNCLDALTRASEKTGAAPFVVHHSRKPSGDDTGGAKMSIRGSSAIFDACAGVFVLAAEKGKPVRVQHEKDRNRGLLMPDFGLRAEDVETAGDPRHGLRIVHLEPEQMASSKTEKEAKSAEHKRAQLLDAATACARIVSETPNIGTKDLRAKLAAALGGCSHDRVDDAVAMCGSAITTRTGKRGTKHHTIDLSTLPLEILTRVGAVGKP